MIAAWATRSRGILASLSAASRVTDKAAPAVRLAASATMSATKATVIEAAPTITGIQTPDHQSKSVGGAE
ncbi:hypothetical protein GCM10027406_30900 [Leifsonia lichenia]